MPKKTMLLIFNPKAGQEEFRQFLFEVVDRFTKAGFWVTVYPTQKPRDAYEMTLTRGPLYDFLVCSGGDGTLNEVIDAMMQLDERPVFGYIPSGSTNDFAYSLGLPRDILLSVDAICNGEKMQVDVGRFGEEYFSYVAAFGLFTDVSYGTPQNMKNMLGHAAYVLEGMKRLTNIRSHRCTICCDGEEFTDDFIFGMITNSESVGGFTLPFKTHRGDGTFEVILLKNIINVFELQNVVAALLGSDKPCEPLIIRTAREIQVKSQEPLDWTLDGEYGGCHEAVNINILKGAVSLMVPKTLKELEEKE